MLRAEGKMAAELAAFFSARKAEMIAPMLRGYGGKSQKDAFSGLSDEEFAAEVTRILDLMNTTPFEDLPADLQPLLEGIAKDGAREGLTQINAGDIADALNALDERAVEWASERSAEMVGKRWVDGKLIENPDATWRIDESTRDLVRSDVTQAFKEGWSNQTLAHALEDSNAFTRERANAIARTETAYADSAANQAAWQESGAVSGKEWIRSNEGFDCDICQANADAGVIGLDETFPSGDAEEPAHPFCECVTVPVLKGE